MEVFCERIKILREEKKMTQKQVGIAINIDESQYRRYELGQRTNPTKETLIKMADIFNTSIDYLVGRSDTRHPEREWV